MKTNLLFSSFPFITSDKVTLSHITEIDLNDLWKILGDDENFRFTPTAAIASPTECAAWLRQAEGMFREKRAVVLGVYPNNRDHHLAGFVEISGIDREIEAVTVNFTLGHDDTGMGYASAAVRAVSEYLMGTIGVHRIQAFVLPINYRGVLVLERCGFQKEGTIREGFLWPDKGIVDLSLYSLLPTDRRPKKAGQQYYL